MENKNKGIIIAVIIILLIVIIGVTMYFTSKSIIKNNETNTTNTETEENSEDDAIEGRIQDNPDEDDVSNVIATPDENEGDSLKNMLTTP